ncbi:MAG: hypothetical protein WAS05_02155 [Candidatus Nanopelagicales bacterium]
MNSPNSPEQGMVIDCDSCTAKPVACDGCVVSFLLGSPQGAELEREDVRMLDVLADSGLVPPLRLVRDESGKMAG